MSGTSKGEEAMAIGGMTRANLENNIARSRGHISKQKALIASLTGQGHSESAAAASAMLEVMQDHLNIEIELLAEMRPE